jgi:hypothetical protein
MTKHLGFLLVLAASLSTPGLVAPVAVAPMPAASAGRVDGLVAHEWGTFTSIAGEDGRAVNWLPHGGPTDLPGFVGRINCPRFKSALEGLVRMETPVIYFYAPRETTVSVSVRFRQGIITEWFPRPAGLSDDATTEDAVKGDIAWRTVSVAPGARADFRVEREPNHYYIARETDAAPLQVGAERERFLFYRGVGRLPPAIAATVAADGNIVVTQTRGDALGDLILFENRDGRTSYQTIRTSSAQVAFPPQALEANAPSPQKHLEQVLVAHGLYPREARAMVHSWEGSWFEHGTRLFYIVANDAIDAILPLQIAPAPSEVKRVFVGRLEIATAKTLSEVRAALEQTDRKRLAQYGRFIEPISRRLLPGLNQAERSILEQRKQTASLPWIVPTRCLSTTN